MKNVIGKHKEFVRLLETLDKCKTLTEIQEVEEQGKIYFTQYGVRHFIYVFDECITTKRDNIKRK